MEIAPIVLWLLSSRRRHFAMKFLVHFGGHNRRGTIFREENPPTPMLGSTGDNFYKGALLSQRDNIILWKLAPTVVSSVAKRTLSVREAWGSIPGPVKSAQCRQRLATVATFLRSCVAQALSRGDGPRNSLHASA